MTYTSNEVKSGIFLTFSLLLLVALTFVVGKYAAESSHPYQIRFSYISGLEKNAPVYVAGNEVGKVKEITLSDQSDKWVLVTVEIPQTVRLHEDCSAYIDTLGMMGEKFVELNPGTHAAPVLKAGSTLEGTDPIPMYLLVQKMNMLADRVDQLTLSLNPMIADLDDMIGGNQESISRMIGNFEQTSANLRDMTENLKHHPWRLIRKG